MKNFFLSGKITLTACFILIWTLAGCDTTPTEIPVEDAAVAKSTETKIVTLGDKALVLANTLAADQSNVDIRGYAELDAAEVAFEKVATGKDDAQAKARLADLLIRDEDSALTRLFRVDPVNPIGKYVNAAIKMPRYNGINIDQMAGKFGIYDVDAPVSVKTWRGWVTIRSAAHSVYAKVDEGDLNYFQTSCTNDNNAEFILDKGAALLVPARTTDPTKNLNGRLELTVEDGSIKIQGLDILSGQIVKRGSGEVFVGTIDRMGGVMRMTMKKGNVVVQSWDEYIKNGGK
ncbi:MAG: hypothetical protein JNN12_13315 [Bacteroidetes Order II. Incertae sedis bacterium]|nr:hypothetical protein [Bacteroidetes Order II. bacterium]